MAIQQRAQPSIYLTFKVLQFVKQLRRRLKPRVPHSATPPLLGNETSLGLDSKALRSIAKGLSRVGLQERKQSHQASNRVCKSPKNRKVRPSLKLQTPGRDGAVNQNISGGEVQHMLNSVDEKLSPPGSALSAIAASDRLLLKQNTTSNFEALSLNEAIRSLACVNDAINTLNACRAEYDDRWLVAQGQDFGLAIDGSFIENYEHLLLRLQTELIDTLSRKVFEALLEGNHDKQQRRLLGWFTEFSDKPRPLSTFPWTIKPSLAVLWGVCWMFYNSYQNAEEGNPRVPQSRVLQSVDLADWGAAPGSSEYVNFGFELTGTQPQPSAQQLLAGNDGSVGLGNVSSQYPDLSGGQMAQISRARAAPPPNLQGSQNISTCLPAHFVPAFSTTHENNHLPGNSGNAITVFPQLNSLDQPWQQLPHPSLPQRPARHLTSIPSVRVTGSAESEGFAPPHQDFASFDIYQPAAQEPQASPLNVITDLSDFGVSPFTMGNCQPPETPSNHAPHVIRHERTSSVNSTSNIPTPVSMSGPRSPLLSPIGDRRPSIASSHGHVRQPSEDRSSNSGDDFDSLRRGSTAFKRNEEPPRNQEGKMVCKHSECTGLTFDRKCEWSKHMDKHDRPYKCNVKGCEKLQGFTYSGGLLRHEREVHKMHGGTKKSLYCPFTDCKRSSGSGFTRKENLAEHIRRVHRRTSLSTDLGGLVIPRPLHHDDETLERTRFPSESPYARIVEVREEEDQLSLKRKRASDAGIAEQGDEDLRAEVKRLRKENEEKDSRLKQLENAVAMLQKNNRG